MPEHFSRARARALFATAAAAITVFSWVWRLLRRRMSLKGLGDDVRHSVVCTKPLEEPAEQENSTVLPLAPHQEQQQRAEPAFAMQGGSSAEAPNSCLTQATKGTHAEDVLHSASGTTDAVPHLLNIDNDCRSTSIPASPPRTGRRRASIDSPARTGRRRASIGGARSVPSLPLAGETHSSLRLPPRRSSLGIWDAGVSSAQRNRDVKRLSKEFLSYCLCHDDDDFWSAPSHDSECFGTAPSASPADSGFFCLDNSDSDAGGDGGCGAQELSLEEMFSFDLQQMDDEDSLELMEIFSFDLEKVADALTRGDALEQLQEVIEKLMATSLEPENDQSIHAEVPELSSLMAGDLSGRMTPGRMTPTGIDSPEAPELVACANLQESLAKRISEAPTPSRHSKVQTSSRHNQLQRRMSVAVDEACAQNQQNLAAVAAQECQAQAESSGCTKKVTSAVRECVMKSHQRHRQSLIQAAEIVELASLRDQSGVSDEWGAEHLTPAQLTTQLQLVQQAIQGAWQNHRQSIAQSLRSPTEAPEVPKTRSCGHDATAYRGLLRMENLE